MSLRKIIVVSTTRTAPKVLHSAAGTWRELQDSLSEFGSVSTMRAVVKETKNDLTSPEAVLPEGDFTLFLTPKQIKAGGKDIVAILKELQDRWNDSIEEIIESIEDGDYDTAAPAPVSYNSGSYRAQPAQPSVSAEDKALLAAIASGRF
jgi:hypothetical protein